MHNEKAVIDQLKDIYGEGLSDVEKRIKKLTFRIGQLQQEYDFMDDSDPEKEKVKSMIQSKIYQKQYQEQLKKQLDDILDRMQNKSFLTVSDYLDECYTDGFIGAVYDQHGQGVPIISPIDQESMVRAVQLDSKISKGLYTKLGEDLTDLKKRIAAQVSRSIATGMTYEQTAKQLEGQSTIGYNRAIRIARTEGQRVLNTAAMDAMVAAKDRGAEVVKQWNATLDAKTRESHAQVDMEVRELNEPFSNGLMFPCDPHGGAAEVVNCRCALNQRARWALESSFTKMNNFTKQIETFESPENYGQFKKAFFSEENRDFMKYVEKMQDKYETKNLNKLLEKMDEKEHEHYSELMKKSPIYHK